MVAAMNRSRAFTLIELLVSLAIVSILFSLALPSYESYQQRSRLTEGKAALLRLQTELERYAMSFQRYPQSLSELLSYDEDELESDHGYFNLYIDSGLSDCDEGACYALVAEPIIETRSDERLELYSDGRREGQWN
ncbi:hypothetical protein A3740_05825 [Oleiphilus sp. HI0068]|jgi:type IV pilus assembly protein PilE|nr:hypothetical protein A3741_00800 [Oleiphilus sp. HI0069]KZY80322.1 hypothetical protein A3741_19110 [Oleiphilus sp. HI0069]KZY82096.1 hypothetical protein A3740_05825 [Oleiphilus sp. HI0068]KZZ47115.1 hypothetical protein A3755_02485 [Oleiphilus sp. HI0085]KZZ71913.1 hypothetical protein A3766_07630 [Oleiphilus sp. HI0132]